MKKFRKIGVFALLVAIFAVSCQQEEHSAYVNPDTLTAQSEVSNRLSLITSFNDSLSDNVIDATSCFRVKLPVSLAANGQPLTLNDESGYQTVTAIFAQSNTDVDQIQFTFPITVVYPNNEELTVANQQQFNLLQGNCPSLGSECIHLVFPVSVSSYNTDFQQQMTYTFNNDKELHTFLGKLGAADTYTINYPIAMEVDGATVTVNNNAQLLEIIIQGLEDCGVTTPCDNPNILANGLILNVPFSNQINDLTGFGNPISVSGQNSFVADRSGHANSAFSFTSGLADDTISINSGANNNLLQTGAFTISFWFNRKNDAVQGFEELYSNGQLQISLGNQINPQIRSPFVTASGMTDPMYDTGWITDNLLGSLDQWHHLVVTYNGELLYLYRDGILQSGSSTVEFTSEILPIGSFGGNFKGNLDDIRIYNRALNNNEINILFQLEGDNNTCLN